MAKDLNKIQFTGHLGADPEMRYTAQGTAVTNFSVASNRVWKDREGVSHEETEWFRVVAWDRLGEICNQYLTKGMRVYIEGRMQTRKWMDRNNLERSTTEVVAQDMIMLTTKGERGAVPVYEGSEEEPSDEPVRRAAVSNGSGREPAPARVPARSTTRNQPQEIESDDDIPF